MRFSLGHTIIAGAVLAGGALAACSGGGATHTAVPSAAAPTGSPATSGSGSSYVGPTAKVVLSIPRGSVQARTGNAKGRHAAAARRSPRYLSYDTEGIQVTVSGNGATQSVYADASTSSPLCSGAQTTSETCTIAVPVLAATETLTVDDVTVTPSGENPTTGYGTGFTAGFVDAAGTTSASLTAGQTTQIALQLGGVSDWLYDCGSDAKSNAMYVDDSSEGGGSTGNANQPGRALFTQGTAGWIILDPEAADESEQTIVFASPSPAFVDVNASPVPITVTSSNQHVTLLTMSATQTTYPDPTPPPTGFGATALVPNQSYQ
jgi:hypothetical protein